MLACYRVGLFYRDLSARYPFRFGSYSPSNFNRDFKGVVPARQALAQSLNIPFVRLLKDYSYARFYDDLKQLGIRSLNRDADHYGLSLIFGWCRNVTLGYL